MSYPTLRDDMQFNAERRGASMVKCDWCDNGKILIPGKVIGTVRFDDCAKCDGKGQIEVGR